MFDGFISSRVKLDPRICLEDPAVVDDDMSAIGNHALDFSPRNNPLFTVLDRGRGGVLRPRHAVRYQGMDRPSILTLGQTTRTI